MSAKITWALSSPREPVVLVECTGVVMAPVHQVHESASPQDH